LIRTQPPKRIEREAETTCILDIREFTSSIIQPKVFSKESLTDNFLEKSKDLR
jgi:hypothetical protein